MRHDHGNPAKILSAWPLLIFRIDSGGRGFIPTAKELPL
jgi:hypothetical protein